MDGDSSDVHFVNSDGLRIFCKYWQPKLDAEQQPRAAVLILHGHGEHCQWYDCIAEPLTQLGILVFAHDHVGHGLSEGDRVHLNRPGTYIDDVIQHVNIVKEKHPDISFFVIGYSMGGTIAVKTILDNPEMFAGAVLIAPGIIGNRKLVTPFMICLAKSVAGLMPQLQLRTADRKLTSRDPAVVQKLADDPLCWQGGAKAKWGVCMLAIVTDILERLEEFSCPFLLLHGSEDQLVEPEGSQMLYDKACSTNKQLKIFPGAYHQVHNEPDGQAEEAISDITDWIKGLISQ